MRLTLNANPMEIIKGTDKFTIVNITPKEMGTIYDAFMNGWHYLVEIQKTKDRELAKAMGAKMEMIPEYRKIIQEKIEFYKKYIAKIKSHEKQ